MAINFPDSPSLNETLTVSDITWTWDGTSWVATASGGGGDTDLTSFSVQNASAVGGGSLTYNNTTGVFTFAPANLSIYAIKGVGDAGTFGDASTIPQITVNADGQITNVTEIPVVGGGGGDTSIERFKLNYASNGDLFNVSNLTAGISSVVIDSTTGGEVTITFNNATYNYPPGSVLMYGYDYVNNVYVVSPLESTMSLRQIDAGGSSGSPTLFNGTNTVELRLRLRESETGASRSFGTTTHAWIQFTMSG